MKVSAIANANIALVKYWGKRNNELILPQFSTISVTLDGLNTITTVEFDEKYEKDIFILDRKEAMGDELKRVQKTLDEIRHLANISLKAKVQSENHFPTAAGLASSASGGAALVLAASKATGLNLSEKELSILARKNSGSASRSIKGGFVKWQKGELEDGSDSYGIQIKDENFWPEFRILIPIISKEEKKIKSRSGMKRSVETCIIYPEFRDFSENATKEIKKAILEKDFSKLGKIAEQDSIKMHEVMKQTIPPIIYWNKKSKEIIELVKNIRNKTECYFTSDAGPQVKVICLQKDVDEIKKQLEQVSGIEKIIICKPGKDASLINEHLF